MEGEAGRGRKVTEQEEFEFRLRLEQEQAKPAPQPAASSEPFAAKLGRQVLNAGAGALRGAGSIGATLLAPVDVVSDLVAGKGLTLDSNRQRRADMDAALRTMGADTDSVAFNAGKIAAEIAGTAGTGGAIANTAARVPGVAAAVPNVLSAIRTGGMTGGNMLTRMAGGATSGAASAALVNPDHAGTGAVVGGAMPVVSKVAGHVGDAVGNVLRGPQMPASTMAAANAAQGAGYVLPPTQVKPSLVNRLLEGTAGKITTAQNASSRNQQVTNALASKAIGAQDLSPGAIQQVRNAANQAYDDIAAAGSFQADQAFQQALASARGSKALPGIANKEVDDLVDVLSQQGILDAQQTIESIKRLRFDGSANRGAQDPTKKALGAAQMKIAGALEDLVDRNLTASGNQQLLTQYRAARQTLAKAHDIEKSLTAGRNVDAKKVASLLQKGRPLTGELREIAEFGGTFPKAAQTPEAMGSLPQFSPVDLWGAGIASGVSGNPLMMTAPLVRPAARSLALSPVVQNRLLNQTSGPALGRILNDPLLYRSAPVLAADR